MYVWVYAWVSSVCVCARPLCVMCCATTSRGRWLARLGVAPLIGTTLFSAVGLKAGGPCIIAVDVCSIVSESIRSTLSTATAQGQSSEWPALLAVLFDAVHHGSEVRHNGQAWPLADLLPSANDWLLQAPHVALQAVLSKCTTFVGQSRCEVTLLCPPAPAPSPREVSVGAELQRVLDRVAAKQRVGDRRGAVALVLDTLLSGDCLAVLVHNFIARLSSSTQGSFGFGTTAWTWTQVCAPGDSSARLSALASHAAVGTPSKKLVVCSHDPRVAFCPPLLTLADKTDVFVSVTCDSLLLLQQQCNVASCPPRVVVVHSCLCLCRSGSLPLAQSNHPS